MNTEKKIFTNTLSLTVGKIAGDLATFIFLIYFARTFGTTYFGQYAFAMSLGGFLTILVSLGLNRLVIREISKDKSQNSIYMGNMLATQSVLAIISWCLIGVIVLLSNFDADTKQIMLIIGGYQIFYRLTQLIHAQFNAHEELEYSAFLEIYHKVVILLFGSMTIIFLNDPVFTLLVYPISAFSMLLLGLRITFKRYGRPDFNIDFSFIKDLLSKAIPFLLLMIFGQFYDRVGVILLSVLQGDEATGIYAATDRFIVTLITGISMFGSALFPVMSRFAKHAPQKLIKTYERSLRIILVSVLPVSTFFYLLSDQIILLLYGVEFKDSADVLAILSWSLLPSGINIILTSILIARNQQNKVVKIELYIMLGFIIACIVLIPDHSFIGLAYAKLITSLTLFLAFSWHLSKTFHYSPVIKIIKAPLLACLVTIVIFKFIVPFGTFFAIVSASFTCLIMLMLTGAIKYHDVDYVRNIVFNKK